MTVSLSVLRFSPDPEEIEHINVALLVENGRTKLIYDNNFPRLSCIAPSFNLRLLRYCLDDFQTRIAIESFSGARDIIVGESSQFSFGQISTLVAPLSRAVIDKLKSKYLGRGREQSTRVRNYVEGRLNEFLVDDLAIDKACILSRATPKDFLSTEIARKLGNNGIRIARVVKTNHHLLLVDGIIYDITNIQSVESRAQKVASAFFRLGRLRGDLHSEGKDLVRASVLLEVPEKHDDGRLEYVSKMLENESDCLVNPRQLSPDFSEIVSRIRSDQPHGCLP